MVRPTQDERREQAIADGSLLGMVLAEVRDMQPVTVADVARGIGIPERAARRLLDELEEAGLVEWGDYQRRARVYSAAEEGSDGEA